MFSILAQNWQRGWQISRKKLARRLSIKICFLLWKFQIIISKVGSKFWRWEGYMSNMSMKLWWKTTAGRAGDYTDRGQFSTLAMLLFFLKNRMTSINCFVTFAYVAGCCVGGERMRRPSLQLTFSSKIWCRLKDFCRPLSKHCPINATNNALRL